MADQPETAELPRAAVQQNLAGLRGFLGSHAPFDRLQPADLDYLLEHCRLAFHAAGETILGPGGSAPSQLRIVYRGRVRGERSGEAGALELRPGEAFPLGAVLARRPAHRHYRAIDDGFCLELEAEACAVLARRSPGFRDYCQRRTSHLLERVRHQFRHAALQDHARRPQPLDTPLDELRRRAPVACSRNTPVATAVQQMHEAGVGSMVVIDAGERPLGIFTLHDLRRLFAAECRDFDQPIERVMSARPRTLPRHARAFDALLLMAHHGFHHVCLIDGERLCGVVSERDLFDLQRVGLVQLARRLRQAESVRELGALRAGIGTVVDGLLAHGASASQALRTQAVLEDHLTARCIELNLREAGYGLPGFSWLVFDTAARLEQPLGVPAISGMLFGDDAGAPDAVRARLLPLAERIVQSLAHFPQPSSAPAGESTMHCLSHAEWQQRLVAALDATEPARLSTLLPYLDLRPVIGSFEPIRRLREAVLAHATAPRVLQRLAGALPQAPALDGALDLQAALAPFVAGARLLALAHGVVAVATDARFAAVRDQPMDLDAEQIQTWREAFDYLQLLRLRHHQQLSAQGRPLDDALDPQQLDPLARRVLREALRQGQLLRHRLHRRYGAGQ